MKKNFLFIAFAGIMIFQSCFSTKHPLASNNQLGATTATQMYPGHTMLKLDEVPQAVRDAWNTEYARVNGEEWYQTDGGYIVYYLSKKLQSRIVYDTNGNQISRSREVETDDVPVTIRDFMKKKYPGIQYGRTYLSYTNGEDDKRYYEVQVDDKKWERFDINGNSIEEK
ncbi:MAG TPA: hypothetical protein VE978_08590 [Chitinophagales bacterium]|nr:hypothetical protein [Chitinophagales bacterium]